MTKQDKRIEELERRVRELEARPPREVHHHYPVFTPYVPVNPLWVAPQPYWGPNYPIVTCDASKHYREDLPGSAVRVYPGDVSAAATVLLQQ